ncbi:cupin domain-containing protein [Streptomyces spectabilis]|uniref:Quercetin dioxygenase-like cupin family protein n=1 Tax=Streptomyces spectabilis TaxID=68270 RepID=A0A7W8B7D5_STRST|nr:cupin domain-containing protein [Streptomyces spectabilis]MBB5109913.1 quercetin dioxygenase-like cupin family protein [Streptomyces spectabilis]GGV56543.1 hypothetical protein GCM10010245_89520 [Streptomyces spectabilis]
MVGLGTEQRARLAELAASVEGRLRSAPVAAEAMARAVEAGEAGRLGDFPGAPVRYRKLWWVRTDAVWRVVDDHAQAQFDEDLQRYRLAVAAVDGLAKIALVHPVARRDLVDYVERCAFADVPPTCREAAGDEVRWARLDAPVGCGGWAVSWPPGATTPWHQHGEALGAFAVLDGELEFVERVEDGNDGQQADMDSLVLAGESSTIEAGRVHRLTNAGGARGERRALSVHVSWLVHPWSCHDHVPAVGGGVASGAAA